MFRRPGTLPESHHWIVKLMKSLGYLSEQQGICLGISMMAAQAAFLNDLETFDKHFFDLDKFYDKHLDKILKNINIKEMLLKKKSDNSISKDESDDLKFLIEVICPLFEGIELYQQGEFYPILHEGIIRSQDFMAIAPLVMPKALEEIGGMHLVSLSTGIYDENELKDLFLSFKMGLQDKPPSNPVSIILTCINHAICITYHPEPVGKWSFINQNELPSKPIFFNNLDEINTLANLTLRGLLQNKKYPSSVACTLNVIGCGNDKDCLKEGIEAWKKSDKWKKIHDIASKEQAIDRLGATWLQIAAQNGDIERVRELVKVNADIERQGKHSNPLTLAVGGGHTDVVSFLLESPKVNVNLESGFGRTPLQLAALHGNLDMVKILLAHKKIDVNKPSKTGETALYSATLRGDIAIIEAMLNVEGIDINKASRLGFSPLHIAVRSGNIQLVRLFLNRNADITATFEVPKEIIKRKFIDLEELSAERKDHLEKFLTSLSKPNTETISLTSEHFSEFLGLKEIGDILREKRELMAAQTATISTLTRP